MWPLKPWQGTGIQEHTGKQAENWKATGLGHSGSQLLLSKVRGPGACPVSPRQATGCHQPNVSGEAMQRKPALLAAGGLGDTYKNLFRTRVYYSPPAQTGAPLAGKEETPEAVGEAVGHAGTTITYWRLCH